MKGKALRKHSLHEKTAASVLLKLNRQSPIHTKHFGNCCVLVKLLNILFQNNAIVISYFLSRNCFQYQFRMVGKSRRFTKMVCAARLCLYCKDKQKENVCFLKCWVKVLFQQLNTSIKIYKVSKLSHSIVIARLRTYILNS